MLRSVSSSLTTSRPALPIRRCGLRRRSHRALASYQTCFVGGGRCFFDPLRVNIAAGLFPFLKSEGDGPWVTSAERATSDRQADPRVRPEDQASARQFRLSRFHLRDTRPFSNADRPTSCAMALECLRRFLGFPHPIRGNDDRRTGLRPASNPRPWNAQCAVSRLRHHASASRAPGGGRDPWMRRGDRALSRLNARVRRYRRHTEMHRS